MKIYTSYFGAMKRLPKNAVKVAICGGLPERLKVDLWLKILAPTRSIFSEYYRTFDADRYTERYLPEVLGELDAHWILAALRRSFGDKDVFLLCYEKPGFFCHRHIVAKWITETTGVKVEEWSL